MSGGGDGIGGGCGDGDVGARNAADGDGEVRGVGKIGADDGELVVALDEAGGA